MLGAVGPTLEALVGAVRVGGIERLASRSDSSYLDQRIGLVPLGSGRAASFYAVDVNLCR